MVRETVPYAGSANNEGTLVGRCSALKLAKEVTLGLLVSLVRRTGTIRSGITESDIITRPLIALKNSSKSMYSCQCDSGIRSSFTNLSL